jgi:hypothetical protein
MRPDQIARALEKMGEALALDPPAVLPSSLIAKCCACGKVGPATGAIELTEWIGGRGHVRFVYCATWAPAETVQGIDFPAQWVYDRDGCVERQGL